MPTECLLCARAGIVLSTLRVLSHLILTVTLGGKYYYHPHFVDEEMRPRDFQQPA